MKNNSPRILMVAGEDSGDLHAARLAAAIKERLPHCQLSGIGGQHMQEAGVNVFFPSSRLAVVGIFEVFNRIPDIFSAYQHLRRQLQQETPDLVVLIDFPDFNLKLVAPAVFRRRIPMVYYISPQVWAWRPARVATINRLVKKVLAILPFEEDFYRQRGGHAEYVGHPLVDEFKNFKRLPSNTKKPLIAILPGSRQSEIKRLLPQMLTAARLFQRTNPDCRFIIPLAPSIEREVIANLIPKNFSVELLRAPLNQALANVSLALVASGTATLETALAEVPMIVIYRVNRLSFEIGRRLISVDHISLVNLIAGEEVVPELIQDQASPEIIVAHMRAIMNDPNRYRRMRRKMKKIKAILGPAGAAEKAAAAVIDCL